MSYLPLAEKLRPSDLIDFFGQEELTGTEGAITKLIAGFNVTGYFPSLILWGPPGCGKTTLARMLAKLLDTEFYEFSAVNTSVKEISHKVFSKFADKPQQELFGYEAKSIKRPVAFLDEIHRFNKSQQDAFLPELEKGKFIFIGATTENPSFEVIPPLLSRTRVIVLKQHSRDSLLKILDKALVFLDKSMTAELMNKIIIYSNGDARTLLNVTEWAANISIAKDISEQDVTSTLQKSTLNFDLKGEEFYNTISALHKCMRGSDPDAGLYWLARMLEAGQDPLYIARRLIRFASEDIGIEDSNALNVATSAFNACRFIGMPECSINLAHAVVYLAKAPKSNQIYTAYTKAKEDALKYGNLPVPMHIRNAPTEIMKNLGYSKNYKYEHSKLGEKNKNIEYFPDKLAGTKYLDID